MQATFIGKEADGKPKFRIDSLIGNPEESFQVKIFQNGTFLNTLNPSDPTMTNIFESNSTYEKVGLEFNTETNFNFDGAEKDTIYYFERHLSDGSSYEDEIKIPIGNLTATPFKVIRLDKDRIKAIFMDKYESPEFSSQDAFNDYFRGIIIEALGDSGSMVPLNLTDSDYAPSIDIIYTHSIIKNGEIIDQIEENDSFKLNGVKNSIYKMTAPANSIANSIIIQGTAGTQAEIKLFGEDNNGNDIPDKIEELQQENLLINDASLTFYINQDISMVDTTKVPKKIFLYKTETNDNGVIIPSHILDIFTETDTYGGELELNSDGKPDKYTFRITDYISEILKGGIDDSPLILKVLNAFTDLPNPVDIEIETYNWDPRSAPILDHTILNGDRRARLKISYSKKL